MKPVLLIAGNFLRENRWPVAALLFWVTLSAVIVGGGSRPVFDDVLFYFKQQAFYAVAFSAFLSGAAIQNERKSRRILAVLSKGIDRREYIGGLLLGVVAAAVIYCLIVAFGGMWLANKLGLPAGKVWLVVELLFVEAVLVATEAMFFSTFLPPIVAVTATGIALGSPLLLSYVNPPWANAVPGALLVSVLKFNFHGSWTPAWPAVFSAGSAAILLWLLASLIFARRDVAVAIE
ncbi:MAG TPA: hypothetical protein VGJ87_19390 [Roseiflexaceae bacterium]|jgi:hypothetical protein